MGGSASRGEKVSHKDKDQGAHTTPKESVELTSNRPRQNQVLILLRGECHLHEWRLSRTQTDELFDDIDDDKNGVLERKELDGGLQKWRDQSNAKKKELRRLVGPLRALLNPNLVELAWQIMDTDGDGKVDKQEFLRFVCICSWRKLRFLEVLHHLDLSCFWGYGQRGSLPTPFIPWNEANPKAEGFDADHPAGTEPEGDLKKTTSNVGHLQSPLTGMVPDWELEARSLLWGLIEIPTGYWSDLWYYTCQNHSLISLAYVDEDHPLDRWERAVTEFTLCGYTLMMLSCRAWLSAVMVANDLPGACSAEYPADTDYWGCVHHNCLCRPGFLDWCKELNCGVQVKRNATAVCAEYGVVDASADLCFGSVYNLHAWLVWAPLYVTVLITIPSLILNVILVTLLSSPCTVWDTTAPDYTESRLKDFCQNTVPKIWKLVFFGIALATWGIAIYMTFTKFFLITFWEYPEHDAYNWTPSHWMLVALFIVGRGQAYLLQLLLFLIMQFNLFAVAKDETSPVGHLRLRWWCSWDNWFGAAQLYLVEFGKWHAQRHKFLRLKYCTDRDPEQEPLIGGMSVRLDHGGHMFKDVQQRGNALHRSTAPGRAPTASRIAPARVGSPNRSARSGAATPPRLSGSPGKVKSSPKGSPK
eukprot:TRINITY_DN65071_c0_g1_i1.p1 TRINITY_DN65071_c0_g1~~TRINITY_DN65071_c0_g1_i1.p1  ORF type:complete len:643 (+),score=148.06 TRINITY_DN65071_c0_g1_i1:95-2023(+)